MAKYNSPLLSMSFHSSEGGRSCYRKSDLLEGVVALNSFPAATLRVVNSTINETINSQMKKP